MAALVGWRRVVLAFIVALIVGSVLGSLVQTQFNLQALEGLGVEISMATRLQTTVQDLLNFAPLYAILFGLSFLFSQGAASLVARLAGQSGRLWLCPLAAAVGLWATLRIVDALAPMPTLIAATRDMGGLLAMLVTAALSGLLFAVLVSRLPRKNDNASAVPVAMLLMVAGAVLPESDAIADEATDYTIETVASGLEHPWSLAFLPDGRMLVTERPGRLRMLTANGDLMPEPLDGVPEVFASGQAGLFDVLPARDFEESRQIYLSYACGTMDANHTCLARGQLGEQGLENVSELFRVQPAKKGNAHYGGRMVRLPDDTLVLTLGDGFDYREQAQRRQNHIGSIVRLNPDGSVPDDNPFAGHDAYQGEIYSYGHRNVQGLYYDTATDTLYETEHGPKGGDELNISTPGANYGWPKITYGVNYDGTIITNETEAEGMVQPLTYWVPSIAPSGLTMLTSDVYPGWKGDLFTGGMNGPAGLELTRIDMENGEVVGKQSLFDEEYAIRDVVQGPDGHLYVATKDFDGIFRVDIAEAEAE